MKKFHEQALYSVRIVSLNESESRKIPGLYFYIPVQFHQLANDRIFSCHERGFRKDPKAPASEYFFRPEPAS